MMSLLHSHDFLRRVGIQLLLGFSSGLPIALGGSTLQAWFSVSNLSLITIGFSTLLAQPYAYKFLWAPLMDKYLPPFLGRRRGWILITQVFLIFILFFLSLLNPLHHLGLILGLALLLTLTSASQDIVIDGYRADILKASERGLGASLFTLGYRIGLIISSGVALGLADLWGWKTTYLCMSGFMLIGVLGNLLAVEPENLPADSTSFSLVAPFIQLVKKFPLKTLLGLLFAIIFYKLGDALVFSLSSTFLLQELHFSLTQVGLANKTVGIVASLLGAFIGGLLLIRLSLFQGLLLFGVLQAFSNLGFWFLAHTPPSFLEMASIIGIDQFCSGLGNVAFMAFLMKLCDSRYSATQYAVLSAFASLGRIYVGPLAVFCVKSFGWETFYFFSFLLSFPGVFFIVGAKNALKNFDSAAK